MEFNIVSPSTSVVAGPRPTPSRRRGRLRVVVLLLMVLVGCGDDDAGSPTTRAPETTTTVAAGTTTTTVSAGDTIFGWVRSFESDSETTVGVDQAEMLSGEAATAAAREDGVIGEDEVLPNDYYIRNPEESTTDFTVAPSVVVTLQACYEGGECVTTEQVDLATWSVLLGAEEDPGLEWEWYGGGSLPYEFVIDNEVIVEVHEVYLP